VVRGTIEHFLFEAIKPIDLCFFSKYYLLPVFQAKEKLAQARILDSVRDAYSGELTGGETFYGCS
jgi:hypothetical protein